MDCSLLIGEQLTALRRLAESLHACSGDAADLLACRELRDRAAAHVQVREQVLLPVLRNGGWKGLNSEALAAHMDLKRALAALCICTPGDADFAQALRTFGNALSQQRLADELWIVPSLRQLTTVDERRDLCDDIERLHDTLVPPPGHYITSDVAAKPGSGLLLEATVVLNSLGDAA